MGVDVADLVAAVRTDTGAKPATMRAGTPAIHSDPWHDLYLTLVSAPTTGDATGAVSLGVQVGTFVMWLWIGGLIMLADEYPDMHFLSPKTIGGSPVTVHMYVADVDTFCRRAAAAGATVIREVADQFYGDRSGQIKDPFGDGPFEYHALDKGFELKSKLLFHDQPVTLAVGPAQK